MDDLELIRAAYEAWNRDDLDAAIALVHEDFEVHSSGVFPGLEPVYRGRDGFRRWWRDLRSPFSEFEITVRDLQASDGLVRAAVHFNAVGRGSGAAVELDYVNEWRIAQGRLLSFRSLPE